MKVLCNKASKKINKDLIRDFFLKIRTLAPLDDMLPRNIALLFFLEVYEKRIENRREKIEINNYNYEFTPCYDAYFYSFNPWISKTSLNLI